MLDTISVTRLKSLPNRYNASSSPIESPTYLELIDPLIQSSDPVQRDVITFLSMG